MPANKLRRSFRSKESVKSKDSDRSKKSDGSKSSDKSKKSDMSRDSRDRSMDNENGNTSTDIDAAPMRHGTPVESREKIEVKIVVLGDWQVGKSSLIVKYTTGRFDRQENLISMDCSNSRELVAHNKTVTVKLQDTGYSETPHVWSDMRDSFGAQVFLVCYALNNRESFNNVGGKWIPALQANFPNVPRILVGCKEDLRDTVHHPFKLIDLEFAKQAAKQFNMEYREVTLLDGDSLDKCMERALELALGTTRGKGKKDGKCVIS